LSDRYLIRQEKGIYFISKSGKLIYTTKIIDGVEQQFARPIDKSEKKRYSGKKKYVSGNVMVTVTPCGYILQISKSYWGTWNDITVSTLFENIFDLDKNETVCLEQLEFFWFNSKVNIWYETVPSYTKHNIQNI